MSVMQGLYLICVDSFSSSSPDDLEARTEWYFGLCDGDGARYIQFHKKKRLEKATIDPFTTLSQKSFDTVAKIKALLQEYEDGPVEEKYTGQNLGFWGYITKITIERIEQQGERYDSLKRFLNAYDDLLSELQGIEYLMKRMIELLIFG